jgi:hypothetical protein
MGELRQIWIKIRPVDLFQDLTDAVMQTGAAHRCHLVIQRGLDEGVRELVTPHCLGYFFDYPRCYCLLQHFQHPLIRRSVNEAHEFLQSKLPPNHGSDGQHLVTR